MLERINNYHRPWLTYASRMRSILTPHLDRLDYKEGKVLDWGCSFGVSTKEIADLFEGKLEVIGMDISLERLLGTDYNKKLMESVNPEDLKELLAKDLPVSYVAGDGYEPPFAANSFQVIFMMNNLTELLNKGKLCTEDLVTVLERNLELLEDEGTLVIGTNSGIGNLLLLIKKQSKGSLSLERIIKYEEEIETDYPLLHLLVSNHFEYQFISDQIITAMKSLRSV